MNAQRTGFGLTCAIMAQFVWGVFPLYLRQLESIEAFDQVGHRVVWSFVILGAYFAIRSAMKSRATSSAREHSRTNRSKTLWVFALAAGLIAINWTTFVWAVANHRVLDASLGYYICPQFAVLLGVIFVGERLNIAQWIAVGLTAVGVAYMANSNTGLPWIALLIACSFGLYALVKKKTAVPALNGVFYESSYLVLPAAGYLAWRWMDSGQAPVGSTLTLNLLLIGTGVMTITPLVLYATALKHIRLSTVGLLQFIGPTIQFAVGLLFLDESFDRSKLIGFLFVWGGVALYLLNLRPQRTAKGKKPLEKPKPSTS